MTSATVRPGRQQDFAAITTALSRAGLPTADLVGNAGIQFWLTEDAVGPVGVIGLERAGDAALLRSLAVVPRSRDRGIGTLLVKHIEREAAALGVRQLALLTETAEPFFARLGYRVVGRDTIANALQETAEFRALCPDSAICMTKALPRSNRSDDIGQGP